MHVEGICTRLRVLFTVATLAVLTAIGFAQQKNQAISSSTAKPSINPMELPLTFEPNQDLTNSRVRFLSRGAGYSLFLTSDEAVLSLSKAHKAERPVIESAGVIRLKLDGASHQASISPEGQFAGKNNYYLGNDPKKWRTSVPTFARVRYASVYPGIDMVYYGNQRRLEHDFIIAPGADPRRIRVAIDGATPQLASNGDLLLALNGGGIRMLKPVVYQQIDAKRYEVNGSYKLLAGNRIGFEIGKYDKHHELVIDPVLSYSTYFGGTAGDYSYAVATSAAGLVYFAGTTFSADFPTQNAAIGTPSVAPDAFVVGINPASGVIFSTYLGGSAQDEARGIAVSNAGNIYVGGFTNSGDFPTIAGGLPTTNHGGTYDGFVTQLNSSGSIVLSGFLGGLGEDQILGMSFDNANNHLLMTGYSTSADFPLQSFTVSTMPSQLYRTFDGAGSWSGTGGQLPDAIEGIDIQAFMITPGSGNFYAGGASGVWHSTDGQVWGPMNAGLGKVKVTCLVNDPTTSGSLYACSDNGLWKFNPTAQQWARSNNGLPQISINAVLVDPTTTTKVYAATVNGVYVSTNSGGSWTTLNSGFPSIPNAKSLVADINGTVYAGTDGTGSTSVLWILFGTTWFDPGNAGLPNGQGLDANSLAYNSNDGRIYAGIVNNGVWVTDNGGASWTQLGTELVTGFSADVNKIVFDQFDQSTLYAATENGVWKSVDAGSTWFRSDAGVAASSVKAMVVDTLASLTNGSTTIYAGSFTQQGFVVSLDSSYSYILAGMFGGDGGAGSGATQGNAITSDPSGNIYVAGNTPSSPPFIPGIGSGAQRAIGGDNDGVLMKFGSNGTSVWGTYIGGSGKDIGLAVAADASSVYTGGYTLASDFPVTAGVFQNFCQNICSGGDGFVAKYSAAGSKQWATYIGGAGGDQVVSMALNGSGQPVLAGNTFGLTFPQANPLTGFPANTVNGFVSVLSTSGNGLIFSSLLGGSTAAASTSGDSSATSVAVSGGSNFWVTGFTATTDFPVGAGAPHSTLSGDHDAFLTEITTSGNSRDISISVTPNVLTPTSGSPVTFNVTVTNNSSTGAAANVRLATNLAVSSLASPNGTCNIAPASCNFGSVPALSSVTATASYTYPSIGAYVDFFTVRTDDDDPNTANNQQNIQATVSAGAADLGIAIGAPATVGRGSQFNYDVSVTNHGPSAAVSFTFDVTFDLSLTPVSMPPGCILNAHVATCSIASLNANQTQAYSFPVNAPFSISTVNSSATVNVAGDPSSANNNAAVTTSVTNSSDLQVFSFVDSTVVVGAPVNINLQYFTNGPDSATNVTLTIPLPNGVTFNSATGMACTGTTTLTCTIGTLNVDDTPTASLSVTVNRAGTFTVTGTIQGSQADPNPSNNQFFSPLTAGSSSNVNSQYIISDSATGQINLYTAGFASPGSPNSMNAGSAPTVSAIDNSGRYAFVSSGGSAYTTVIDFTIGKEVARIHGAAGRPMVLTPDGSLLIARVPAAVPGPNVDSIAIINTSTFQIVKTISFDGILGDQVGTSDLNIFAGVAANNKVYLQLGYVPATGSPVYSTVAINLGTNAVSQVTGSTAVGTTSTGAGQRNIAASADGTKVYALRNTPSTMLVINTSTDAVTQTLDLTPFTNVRGLAVTQDVNDQFGQFAYVVGRRSSPGASIIKAVDLKTLTLLSQESTLSFNPTIVVLSSTGNYLHVFQNGPPTTPHNAAYTPTANVRNGPSAVQEYQLNNDIGGVSMGLVADFPSPYAPQVVYTNPPSITNTSVPTPLNILGTNFAPGATVKIGNQDPQPATFISSGRLDYTIPAGFPEQDADIVVTLPNSQELPTGRNVSGSSFVTRLTINTGFQLNDPLIILSNGTSKLELVTKDKNGHGTGTIPNPLAVQVTPDGSVAYVSSPLLFPNGTNSESYIQAISLTTFSEITKIKVANDSPGTQDGIAVSTDPVDGKPVLYYLAVDSIASNPTSDQLYIVDIDQASPNYGQVKRTIRSPFNDYSNSATLVATPDGRYVYATYEMKSAGKSTRMEQFDTLNGTVTGVSTLESLFNVDTLPIHMRMTTDGNWILLPGTDGSIKAFDVTNRSLAGLTAVTISDAGKYYKNFQAVGNRLFAFDAINNVVAAFNFLPAQSNFSKLGQFVFPGPGTQFDGAMRIDPTGSFAYVGLKDQDTVVVMDANKIAASDSSAVLAKGNGEGGMNDIQIAPAVPPAQVDLGLAVFPQNVAQGAAFTVSGVLTNNSPVIATGTVLTFTVPAGVNITSAAYSFNFFPYQAGLCTIAAPTVTCSLGSLDQNTVGFELQGAPTESTGTFNFQATVTSIESDSNPNDNAANADVIVTPGADVSAVANFPTGAVQAGQPISFTFTVDNAGPATATEVHGTVSASLVGLQLDGQTCPQLSFCQFSVGNLDPNTPTVYTVSGTVPNQNSPLILEVDTGSSTADPNPNNNNVQSAPIVITSSGMSSPAFLVANVSLGKIQAFDPAFSSFPTDISAGVFPRQALTMPNGRTAFLINNDAAYISVADLSISREIFRIRGIAAAGGTLTSDGTTLIVSDRITNDLVVIDTSSFSIIRRVANNDIAFNLLAVGSKVFFLRQGAGAVGVLDIPSGTLSNVGGTQIFSRAPGHLALTPDATTLIAVGGGNATVAAELLRIDVASNSLLQTLTLPINTTSLSLAVTPAVGANEYAFVSMNNNLRAVDVKAGSPTLGQLVAGINRDITISATSSCISQDGKTLVFVQQGAGLATNLVFTDAANITDSQIVPRFVSGSIASVTSVSVDFLPPATAPQVTAISPSGLLNDAPSALEVDGLNFTSDSVVKIGSADPIIPVFVDSTKLTLTLPAFTPSGSHDVVVINRNQSAALDQRNQAGLLIDESLGVADGLAYTGQWSTFVANFGDATVTSTDFTSASTSNTPVGNPWGIAATNNGVFFLTSQSDAALVSSIESEGLSTTPLPGQVGYGDAIAIVSDVQSGRTVALAPSAVPSGPNVDWQLNVVDADPFSPTVNLVIRTIPANSGGATPNPNGFAAAPDGKFAYGFFNAPDSSGRLAVYNLTNNTATVLTSTSLGVDSFIQDAQVSPDSKYLAVANAFTNTIKIFDVTNPTSPVARGTITTTVPNGTFPSCCNMRFTSNQLFVFDPGTMQLQVFNFKPTVPDFSSIGLITVPGNPDPVWQGGLAVSPDGALVYVAQSADDSMAVFDAGKVAASDPSALITRIKTGRGPVSIAINPVPTFSTTADLAVVMNHTPDPVVTGSDITFNVTVTNNGPFPSDNVAFVDDLPTGMLLTGVSTPSQVTCLGVGTAKAQCDLGDSIPSGTSYNFTLTASTTNATGALQNVGRVVTPGSTVPDPNMANNTFTDPITVGSPDLAISLTSDIPVGGINGVVNYTATVINNGGVPATGVSASLHLDAGPGFISSPECSVDSSAFCNIGTLNAGQSVVLHLVGRMPDAPTVVTASASTSEDETDANSADNTTSLQLNVVNPDLTITITANPMTPVVNNLVTYTATIKNNSPAVASNVFAILRLDTGNIISSTECNLDGPAFCNVGTIAGGQTVALHVVAQMPITAGDVKMTGTVTLDETDTNPADNAAALTLTVGGGADLSLTPANAPTIIGGVPTYTVTVTNHGPDVAPNVVVTDELTRFQFVSAVSSVGACSYNGIQISCPIGNLANGASATVNVSVIPPNSGWASSEFHAKSDTLDPNGNNNIANLGPTGGNVGNTHAGFNVLVDALDAASGMPASFAFANVTKPGLTSVQSGSAPSAPAGYRFGQPARLYELTTTASYSGSIQVTLQFAGTSFHHPNKVRVLHLENGVWVDRTSGIDATRGLVTAVTPSLSPFILVEPLNAVPVANAGTDSVTPAATVNGNQVMLNGAASSDTDGDTLTYRWTGPFPEGNGSVTGIAPTITLPMGASKVTLVVNDGESDSAPVSANVVVSDFLLATPATQVALRRGQSASFDVAITPKFGAFDAAVALACGNLPSGVNCAISNPSVTPGGQGVTATVTLTANTTAGLTSNPASVFAFWLGGFPVFGLLMTGSLRPRNWRGWLLLFMVLVILFGMVACGGGGKMTSAPSANPTTTPSTTATITVTGTAGTLQHSTTATVVIQQ